jgi:FMN reductase
MPSTTELRVLGVAGSTRENSYSLKALKVALDNAKNHGAEARLLEIGKANIPLYLPSASPPDSVTKDVEWADAFILASPDYHGSMSGALKNLLDFYYEEFAGKVFGYIVASHEKGLTVMDQMRTAVRQCYGWSMPYGVSINGEQDFANGSISNPRIEQRLKMMSRDLVVYGRLVRGQFMKDVAGDNDETFAARYRQA